MVCAARLLHFWKFSFSYFRFVEKLTCSNFFIDPTLITVIFHSSVTSAMFIHYIYSSFKKYIVLDTRYKIVNKTVANLYNFHRRSTEMFKGRLQRTALSLLTVYSQLVLSWKTKLVGLKNPKK